MTPLREGGSLPAIIEADDDGMYVLKFRGAGQGTKALIAEVIAGGISKAPGVVNTETHIAFRAYSKHDLEEAFAIGFDTAVE